MKTFEQLMSDDQIVLAEISAIILVLFSTVFVYEWWLFHGRDWWAYRKSFRRGMELRKS